MYILGRPLNDVEIMKIYHRHSNNWQKRTYLKYKESSVSQHWEIKHKTRLVSTFLSWVVGLNTDDIFENHK